MDGQEGTRIAMSQDRSPPLSTYPSSTFEQRMHPAAIIADDEHRADSARIPFAAGELLAGVYEVRDALGQGGMGVVFEAQDRLLSRRVAIRSTCASKRKRWPRSLTPIRSPSTLSEPIEASTSW
jgi:serine/threonine protein kinase